MIDTEFYLRKHQTDDFLAGLIEKYGPRFERYREDWDRTGRHEFVPDFPLHISLDLTNYCNLRCRMCQFAQYSHDPKDRRNLDLAILERILAECQDRLPALLIGAAAEGLLHPRIDHILRRIHQAGIMDTMVATNGLLLDADLTALIIELPLARVQVSLDAATPETYRRIRGGDLSLVEGNVRRLVSERKAAGGRLPYTRVTFVSQPDNAQEEEQFLAKWSGVVDRVDFQMLIEMRGDDDVLEPGAPPVTNVCAHPFNRLSIGVNGDVYPCCTFYRKFHRLGNINEQSLETLWRSDKMERLRQSLRTGKLSPACTKCLTY